MDRPLEENLQQLSKEQKIQLILSQENMEEDSVNLRELMKKVVKAKKMIALFTLVAFILSSLSYLGYSTILKEERGRASTIISLNFEGIEEGLNPLGEIFSISEFANKKVLDDTINQLALKSKGITSEDLRENLNVEAVVPQEVLNQMMTINKMAEKDVTQLEKIGELEYHPTQYKLDLHILKDMNLTGEEAEQVLSTLVDNYKTYFMEKYNDKQLVSTAITTMEPTRYDYSEYILMADNSLEEAKEALEEKMNLSPDFRSKTTGLSFADVISQIELVRSIEINNVQALINNMVLTKDKERLVSMYQNKISTMTLEMQKHAELAGSLRKAAADYKKDSLVVMGKEGADSNIEVTQSSETYDKFVSDAVEAQNKADKLKSDVMYYSDLLAKLNPETKEANAVDTKPYKEQVEKDINHISEKVKALITTINDTLEDYYTVEVFKSSVRKDMPPLYQSNKLSVLKQGILVVFVVTLLGAMVGVGVAMSKGFLKEDEEGKLEEGNHE